MNALKHGMAAEQVVTPGEDPAEIRASHRSFITAWQPVGAIEAKLVWEITIADWRLRRARRMEPLLVEMGHARSEKRNESNYGLIEALSAGLKKSTDAESQESDELEEGEAEARDAKSESDELNAAASYLHRSAVYACEMFFDSEGGLDAIRQLLRYEAAAERSYYRAFHTLERVQARRLGKDVSPPQVMHVHANE